MLITLRRKKTDNFVDLYTDYLISSSSYTTATGMSHLLCVKHDKITRALSTGVYDSKFLQKTVKPYIEELTQAKKNIILSFDDSIQEKQDAKESELNTWYFDHVFGILISIGQQRLVCVFH